VKYQPINSLITSIRSEVQQLFKKGRFATPK
jgi:hypothetical protein